MRVSRVYQCCTPDSTSASRRRSLLCVMTSCQNSTCRFPNPASRTYDMNQTGLRSIFDKTKGHCHFCGDPLRFENRGWSATPNGHWEVDHVIQRDKGGARSSDNCLPACTRCNRLRWHRTGEAMRELLFLGVIATDEIKKKSDLGRKLSELRALRLTQNRSRRVIRARAASA